MTLTLESHPIDLDPDVDETPPEGGPRLCACGCGEPLRDGAKRAFLRGHKARMDADNIGADPDPSDDGSRRTYRKPSQRIQKEVQDTVEAYLAMIFTGWAMKDPVCGTVALDITPNVAEKAVPLLCRNPKIVSYLTKGNNFKDVMDFIIAVLPLVQIAYAHHLSHTVGVGPDEQPVQNYNDYVA